MIIDYCFDYEKIENYDLALKDNFKGWTCHHRLETHNSEGLRRAIDIIRCNIYEEKTLLHF